MKLPLKVASFIATRVLDALFGEAEEFEYKGHTTPKPRPCEDLVG